ncbi:hypothetical protein [Actinomadura sp. 6N118]|uniref:hypothetical protein n=1 Tax=Actinomadura sp. 6N118 TaxID=3375151 RepID=UPI00378E59E4
MTAPLTDDHPEPDDQPPPDTAIQDDQPDEQPDVRLPIDPSEPMASWLAII